MTITAAQLAVTVTAESDRKCTTAKIFRHYRLQSPCGLLSGHELSGISASGSGERGEYRNIYRYSQSNGRHVDVTENYDVTLSSNLTITSPNWL